MSEVVKQKSVFDRLRHISSAYPKEVQRFAKYLEENGLGLEGAGAFLKSLESETRIDREGKEVSYSASWYNQPECQSGEASREVSSGSCTGAVKRPKVGCGETSEEPKAEEDASWD